ncbi:hypothetical protein ABZ863_35505, partial [Saccharomonospora sp. NPDC046836]
MGPLIVTEDPVLLDDLLRLCAAAGARPLVLATLPERRGEWEAAPLVLVGDDAAVRMERAPRRPGVLLVGRDQGEPAVWQWACGIGRITSTGSPPRRSARGRRSTSAPAREPT